MLILSLILILLFVAGDQAVKYLAVTYLQPDGPMTVIPGLLEFRYVENTGAAFGLLGDYTLILSIITAVCVVVVLAAMIFYQKHSFFSRVAGILIVGGGIGNLIDRIAHGYVVDMFALDLFQFPVFNVADIFVVCGGIAFCIAFLLPNRSEARHDD